MRLKVDKILKQVRYDKKLKFPIGEVILVEGITEEILLPVFAKLLGYDFYAHGIQVIAAGGKNQVVKMYYKLSQELRIPIFVLLDKDAEDNINQIKPKLRDVDRIHLVSCGEFEDLLPLDLVKKTLEYELSNISILEKEMFDSDEPRAKILEEHRLYTDDSRNPMKAWSEMEEHSFREIVKDYEALGGTDYVHHVVLPEMNRLYVIKMSDLDGLKKLYDSRKVK